ncbi:MAG TPA: rhodanese-like domain-containing protein [Solirubrobacter sp.]|nr:rhodanese-like domain-containing protein [Solirubrobacter sp.]
MTSTSTDLLRPDAALVRLPRRRTPQRQPAPVPGAPGLFTVDATWGAIQPHELPGGVRTVGELEVLDHLRAGGLAIDTRQPDQLASGTLPGAIAIRHQEIVDRLPGDAHGPIVLFCNGPQCAATPQAVAALLAAGHAPDRLRYYRGGIHDWVTLGLPLTTERS